MNQFKQFQNALLLETISKNTFKVNPDSKYFVGKTPHGGYLNALMHRALILSLPHSVAISSSIQYLDRIEAKDIILEVDVLKVSRGSSSGVVKFIPCMHGGIEILMKKKLKLDLQSILIWTVVYQISLFSRFMLILHLLLYQINMDHWVGYPRIV